MLLFFDILSVTNKNNLLLAVCLSTFPTPHSTHVALNLVSGRNHRNVVIRFQRTTPPRYFRDVIFRCNGMFVFASAPSNWEMSNDLEHGFRDWFVSINLFIVFCIYSSS